MSMRVLHVIIAALNPESAACNFNSQFSSVALGAGCRLRYGLHLTKVTGGQFSTLSYSTNVREILPETRDG